MEELLTKAGLKPEVHVINCYHYLECLNQEEAKKQYDLLPPYSNDIVEEETTHLPPMLRINTTYFERSIFPFIVACGHL